MKMTGIDRQIGKQTSRDVDRMGKAQFCDNGRQDADHHTDRRQHDRLRQPQAGGERLAHANHDQQARNDEEHEGGVKHLSQRPGWSTKQNQQRAGHAERPLAVRCAIPPLPHARAFCGRSILTRAGPANQCKSKVANRCEAIGSPAFTISAARG